MSWTRPCALLGDDARGKINLVLPDVLDLLTLADDVNLVVDDHDLGSLRERVVVLGAHARAVGARGLDDNDVTRHCFTQHALRQSFRFTRRRRHEVSRLAAVTAHDVGLSLRGPRGVARDDNNGMLRTIQAWPQHVSHASVELDERVALGRPCLHDVVNGGDEAGAVGREEGAGLDLEVQLPAELAAELLELILHNCAVRLQVRPLVRAHAGDLVASAEVEHRDLGELLAQGDRHARAAPPHGRV
mmetsp:Transcript_20211/g.45966  ORF Transcript_20211/g.45966 Transcript_20211/m.45966 type:complete len:245 (-) Transcript_20211:592-1326(-)